MSSPEERAIERERIAIAATPSPLVQGAAEVSWSGVSAGVLTALGTLVLLLAFGVALGLLDTAPGGAPAWTLGAVVWPLAGAMVALYLGGLVSTRTGSFTARPAVAVTGTVVWVLVLVAIMGVVRLFLGMSIEASGALREAAPTNVERAAPQLAAALESGNVERILAQLGDGPTVDRLTATFEQDRERVTAVLADVRRRVEASRGDAARAVSEVRAALQPLAAPPRVVWTVTLAPSAAGDRGPARWAGFLVLLATLGAAVAGAATGARAAPYAE